MGLRLRDLPSPHLTYCDVVAVLRQSPPDSAIARSVLGAQALHGNDAELLRAIEFRLKEMAFVMAGAKGRRPEPISFPWEKPERLFEFDVMTTDEVDAFLGWDVAA